MKLITLTSSAQSFRRHMPQAAALGCLAFALQVACSDAPVNGSPTPPFTAAGTNAGGTTANTAGTPAASGTFSASGTFGTAGTFDSGGSATAGTGGAATAGTATAGTGGTVVVIPTTPYCMGKTPTPLPYMATDGFKQAGWDGAIAEIKTGEQIVPAPAVDYCTQRAPGAVGDCSMWQWTPDPTTPAYADVRWIRMFDAGYTHPQVCLADGAKYISFYARGAVGGEKITVGGAGIPVTSEVEVTLTDEWAVYSAPLDGVMYNTYDSGVENVFSWKAEPPSTQITFWIDNIQVRKDLPTIGGGGGGGTGGSGGTGGTGGSGGSGGSNGGTGGN